MAKTKWITEGKNAYGEPFHYFVSSVAEWRTGTDLENLLSYMKKQGYVFNVWKVDLPETAGYSIKMFMPDVSDDVLHFVGFWDKA